MNFFTQRFLVSRTDSWIKNSKTTAYQKNRHIIEKCLQKMVHLMIFRIFFTGTFWFSRMQNPFFFTYRILFFTYSIFSKFSRTLWDFHGYFLVFFHAHFDFSRKASAKFFTEGSAIFT